MSLTLTADITATARTLTVTGTVPASVEPGYRFRLDDELLEFTTFALHDVAFPSWTEQHQNPQAWKVLRGRGGTVAAPHTAGVTVEAVLGGLVAAADDDPLPDPFASGGGGSLPTGWTQDEGDPANVDAGSGSLTAGGFTAGAAGIGGVVRLNTGSGVFPMVRSSDSDPSAVGFEGELGSLLLRSTGQAWLKDGAGNTDWTQLGGVPAAAIKTVRVPIAFDDTPVTPFTVYTPAAGEAIIWKFSYISVTEAFDGTEPYLWLSFTDFAGAFTSFDLSAADSVSGDGHTMSPLSTLDTTSDVGYFPDTDPLLALIATSVGDDPNDPTPLTTGAAELVLVIVGL